MSTPDGSPTPAGTPAPEPSGNRIARAFGLSVGDQVALAALGALVLLVMSVHVWRIKGGAVRPIVLERTPADERQFEPQPPNDPAFPSAPEIPSPPDRPSDPEPVRVAVRRPAFYQVDIQTATWVDLAELPGVGEVLAKRIVDYRARHGGFDSVEELQSVPGIGRKTFAKLLPHVMLSAAE